MTARQARRPFRLLVTLLALLPLASCYAVQPRPAAVDRPDVTTVSREGEALQQGGDLTMGLSAEPDVLDPTTSGSLYTRYVMNAICEKLYDIDANSDLVPQLASDLPTVSDQGRTVTIPLREGIKFADGTDFDSAAVKTTLERNLTKADSARASEMGPIQNIETPDPQTVVLDYKTPFAPITASLADRAGMIMSPTALEELGDEFGESPTCVGPFKFVERVPATSISVEKDPNYYDADEVMLDSITYQIITDANIRAANVRSGDVDVIDTVSPQDVDLLQEEPGIGLLQISSLGYQAVTFNIGNVDGVGSPPGEIEGPIAEDRRVRQAFEHSLDRDALVNSVFNDWFEPACSPISPETEFATRASNACPAYDPELSLKLLEEAGVDTPVRLEMSVSNTPDTLRLAQAIQGSVKDGGFDVEIQPVEYTTLLDAQDRGDFDILQLGWSGRIDPHSNMFIFLATGQSSNYSGYGSEKVDRLLEKAARQFEVEDRARTYGQVMRQVAKDDPLIYLYRQRNLTAYSEDVVGVSTFSDGVVRLSRAAFVEDD